VDVGGLGDLRQLEQRGVVDLERLLHEAVDLELERLDGAVAFVASHRAEELDHALAGRKARAAIGSLLGACLLGEVVSGDAEQRTTDRHQRAASGSGLDEVPAIPLLAKLGVPVEIGLVRRAGHDAFSMSPRYEWSTSWLRATSPIRSQGLSGG